MTGAGRRVAWPLLAVLALFGALLSAALAAREVEIPGHRGARRVVSGFVPGRWDARFLVARGPAALDLPAVPLRVSASLSGPAQVSSDVPPLSPILLGSEPQAATFDMPQGGRLGLVPDGTFRLHSLTVRRTGRPSAAFAALVISAWWERARPVLALVGIVAGLVLAAAAGGRTSSRAPWRLSLAAGAVVGISCLAQVLWRPQPLVIGDPGAYYDMAGRFRDALASPATIGESVYDLRPYAGLAFTATLYGLLRLVRDAASTIYVAHACAMAGAVFFLVRAAVRAFGRRTAVLTAVFAATYATFPIVAGIVQPEPFILLLWTFTLDRLVGATLGDPARRLVPAGLAFALGLALHPQGIWYLLAAAVLLLIPFAPLLRRPFVRRAVCAFAAGVLPVAVATSVGEAWARPAVKVLDDRYGFFAYTVPYPLGFWLFLDTDGWQAGQRLDETRYVTEFQAAMDRGEIEGGARAWAFTIGFVARHPVASTRAVLRNLYRLYARPDNPFHRTWVWPYRLQVAWHRALIVAVLLAVPLLVRSAEWAVVLPVGMLAATYPLYHIFNKYALPATPFVILGAAVLAGRWWEHRSRWLAVSLVVAALGAVVDVPSLVFAGVPVALARVACPLALMAGLAAAFAWVGRRWAEGWVARVLGGAAALALMLAVAGARWDDPSWRAFSVAATESPRYEITLSEAAQARLAKAREAYVALDLHLLDGDPADLRIETAAGPVIAGQTLKPTMPTFGLATVRGGRDPRRFAQWWVFPWRPEMARDGRFAVTVRGDATSRLGGDVGHDRPGTHHGLSLGQRPDLSVYRLMHEGEYRLPVHLAVEPAERRSWRHGQPFAGTYGVRLVVLEEVAESAIWETERAPTGEIVTAVWARAGRSGWAEMLTPAGPVAFELAGSGPWKGEGGELRYVSTGDSEGWYVLHTRNPTAGPLSMAVRVRQQMLSVAQYFLPEPKQEPPYPEDWARLARVPLARVVAAREAPYWRAATVY